MNLDTPSQDRDLSSVPGEFRENYRFLSELIACSEKNSAAAHVLEELVLTKLHELRGKLNRRQIKILTECLQPSTEPSDESLQPPVPAELEASIRVKIRTSWLPWEAEAIRKIDRWRSDIRAIVRHWNQDYPICANHNRVSNRSIV
jgi:hypothetical protein